MDRDFLGRGLRFPVDTDDAGRVELSAAERDIEESIRIIIGTSKGERVMRPEFGCGIHDYVFSTIDTTTLHLIESTVEEALTRWEPRIDVQDVEASAEDIAAGKLTIRVGYRVRSTNTERNLVYPFYLTE